MKISNATAAEVLRRLSAQAHAERSDPFGLPADLRIKADTAREWLNDVLWNVENGEAPAGLVDAD